jgi:xylan 1,4-beta-xylosidase
MGRETFLLPVTWRRGWPQILPAKTAVPQLPARPQLPAAFIVDRSRWRDAFDSRQLSSDWEMIRTPAQTWYSVSANPGALTVRARGVSISSNANPSFLGKRQRHEIADVETEFRYAPTRSGDRAGLVAFADERHHYFFGLLQTPEGPMLVVAMRNGADDPEDGRVIAAASYTGASYTGAAGKAIRLRISARGAAYGFSYAITDEGWRALLANADGRILASEPTNQFTGTLIGVYAARSAPAQ